MILCTKDYGDFLHVRILTDEEWQEKQEHFRAGGWSCIEVTDRDEATRHLPLSWSKDYRPDENWPNDFIRQK